MKETEIYDNGADINVFLSDDDIRLGQAKASERQAFQGSRDFRQAEMNEGGHVVFGCSAPSRNSRSHEPSTLSGTGASRKTLVRTK